MPRTILEGGRELSVWLLQLLMVWGGGSNSEVICAECVFGLWG